MPCAILLSRPQQVSPAQQGVLSSHQQVAPGQQGVLSHQQVSPPQQGVLSPPQQDGCPPGCASLPVSRYRLLPDDSPQLATLPDLGNLLRGWVVHTMTPAKRQPGPSTGGWCHLYSVAQRLFDHHQKATTSRVKPACPQVDQASVVILLNLLLATLLGLYVAPPQPPGTPTPHPGPPSDPPAASGAAPGGSRPAWEARVNIYRRVHVLLTSPASEQLAFASEHGTLLNAALVEYICRVLPRYMPAEADLFAGFMGGAAAQQSICARLDAFRRDCIDDGAEPWAAWADALAPLTNTVARAGRVAQARKRGGKGGEDAGMRPRSDGDLQATLQAPVLTLYEAHEDNPAQIRMDYQLMGVDAVPCHAQVSVAPLPECVTALQMSTVRALAQRCERRAHVCRKKVVCLRCAAAGRATDIRLTQADAGESLLMCARDCPDPLVPIDMIGKVLKIGDEQFIFAPCCAAVRQYKGDAHQLWRSTWEGAHPGPCTHTKSVQPPTPPCLRCVQCGTNLNLTQVPNVLDHRQLTLKTVYTCPRHTPPKHIMDQVTNMDQLLHACTACSVAALGKRCRHAGRRS